jgi:hypothetical protein
MRLTGKRLILAAIVLAATVLAYVLLRSDDNGLRLDVQVAGTVTGTQASGTGVAAAPFGNVSLTAAGSAGFEGNCAVFDGSGELKTGAGTLRLRLPKPGRACLNGAALDEQAEGVAIEVSGSVDATGIDGSLLGRHGRLKARGTYDTSSDRFTVVISGRLRR